MRTLVHFIIITNLFFLATSCQKTLDTTPPVTPPVITPKPDTPATTPKPVYLKSIERRSLDSTLVYSFGFEYNSQGRITRVYSPASNPASTTLNIVYHGNEAMLTPVYPDPSPYPGAFATDTVWMTLDTANRALTRIHKSFLFMSDTLVFHAYKTFIWDTTVYEYNTEGLLTKETQNLQDSVIYVTDGIFTTDNSFHTTITTHTISNGNVIAINQDFVRAPGDGSLTKNTTFEYNDAYPNNALLSNPGILNELHLFYELPVNNGYKNMPDKMVIDQKFIDPFGNIGPLSTIKTYGLTLTFDADGRLATYFDSNEPTLKWYYRYGN